MAFYNNQRKRKQVNPKRDATKKPKRADKPVSLPQQHVDDEEEECQSSYQLLINSLPTNKKRRKPTDWKPHPLPPAATLPDDVTLTAAEEDVSGDKEDVAMDTVFGAEPFARHFEYSLKEEEVKQLTELYTDPGDVDTLQNEFGLVDWLTTPTSRTEWADPTDTVTPVTSLKSVHIRQPMATSWKGQLSPLQLQLFNVLNSYKDLLYAKRTSNDATEIRRVYLLHVLNHVIKSRSHVLKNNTRLAAGADIGDCQDQGLTRPKVLILLPFKNEALKVLEAMTDIMFSSGKGEVSKKKRFMEEFGSSGDGKPPNYKPKSYTELFEGNTDDCFKVGVSIKKNSINLYKPFYSCDIILATPLGLRLVIGGEGEKERDYDYLSSIEIVIADQLDVYLMQNWDHLLHVFNHLHMQPKEGHGVDFSRVREWALNGNGKYYCQNVFLSNFVTPEINALAMKQFRNYEGHVKVTNPVWAGSVCQVLRPHPQVFHRFKTSSCKELAETRYSYFIDNVVPKLTSCHMDQTCVYIPSYFDFVRIRNHLKKEEVEFVAMSEYTRSSSLSRARSFFSTGHKRLLLITERLHFFRRYKLTGIRHLIFYGLPTYHEFYPELINMIDPSTGTAGTVLTLYSQYDVLALQRVVGSDNAASLLESSGNKQTIVTGGD